MRKIDDTTILFLQNRQQRHAWTLIGWGANGPGIQEWNESKMPLYRWRVSVEIMSAAFRK